MAEIDHECTEFIVCPYCGHVHVDSWEWNGDDERERDGECEACGKPFRWTRHVSIKYSTQKGTP